MSNPLVTTVRRDGEDLFSIYEHWGGGASGRIDICCHLISCLDRKADLPTLLRQACGSEEDPFRKGCGLLTDRSWFDSDEDYEKEEPIINAMLAMGIPACTNKNAGLIAFTEKAMAGIEVNACDTLTIELDRDITLADLLDYEGTIDDCIATIHSDYDEDEAQQEIDAVLTAPPLPDFAHTTITAENANEILSKWIEVADDTFQEDRHVWRAYES